jgi:hypothetical protein
MAASSSLVLPSQSLWRTQAWAPPLPEILVPKIKTCGYCGTVNPAVQCTGCSKNGYCSTFCNVTCQKKAWPVHKHFCEKGSFEKMLELLVNPRTLCLGLALSCTSDFIVDATKGKYVGSPETTTYASCFAQQFDHIRKVGVQFASVGQSHVLLFGDSIPICGQLNLGTEGGSHAIPVCENSEHFMFTVESSIFFCTLALLKNEEDQKISGDMMAAALCLYNHMLSHNSAEVRTYIGVSIKTVEGGMPYTILEAPTLFNAQEIIDVELEPCHLYLFNLTPTLPSDMDLIDASKPYHIFALFHFKGEYCIIQSYLEHYTYSQWLDFKNPLSLAQLPHHDTHDVKPFHALEERPAFRKRFGREDLQKFFDAIKSLTYPGKHKQTYVDLTGIHLKKKELANVYNVKCTRFDFSSAMMV